MKRTSPSNSPMTLERPTKRKLEDPGASKLKKPLLQINEDAEDSGARKREQGGRIQDTGKILVGCSDVKRDYEFSDKLGEGTFGEVYKGVQRVTGEVVALKKILMHNEKDGVCLQSIPERLTLLVPHYGFA